MVNHDANISSDEFCEEFTRAWGDILGCLPVLGLKMVDRDVLPFGRSGVLSDDFCCDKFTAT